MIHTYRDPDPQRINRGQIALVLVIMALLAPMTSIVLGRTVRLTELIVPAVFVGAALLILRHSRDRRCLEVRLDDDGICELETADHVTRIHVREIDAVEYRRDSENAAEHYVIRYRSGKADVSGRTPEFGDFLQRVKALNPAVDLSTFPAIVAETLPPGEPAAKPRGLPERFARSALFPLFVIALIVWLAGQTLIK